MTELLTDAVVAAAEGWLMTRPLDYTADENEMRLALAVRDLIDNRSERPSFTCPRCGRTSYHPDDIAEGYCGACNDWPQTSATATTTEG